MEDIIHILTYLMKACIVSFFPLKWEEEKICVNRGSESLNIRLAHQKKYVYGLERKTEENVPLAGG